MRREKVLESKPFHLYYSTVISVFQAILLKSTGAVSNLNLRQLLLEGGQI